ncbi:MAG: hypothetical protein KAH14_09090 [Clostridiales bacterium]|nr:hypothetical protein [Clostridiales bacterium]
MKKSVYIILAVIIAAGLTVAQALIASSISKRNEIEVCTAVNEIKVGNIIFENDIETIKIYKGEYESRLLVLAASEIIGKTASHNIVPGSIMCLGDIDSEIEEVEETGFVALEVDGENFNAGNLEKGDFIDLYMMPDLSEVEDGYIIWLNNILAQGGVKFIPGKQPGVLIENVLIDYIDTATGQAAKYVSIRVPRPIDEAIAFLEQISVYEFIGR